MMHFLYPSLAAGFLLVAAPLIVHLINMLRHRRQQWAAMEFLLVAYRKQRKWVILRQLLLLALRTLAMLLLVAMLAGWVSGSRLLDALGGNTQHHLVILDDSFSMEDRSGGNAAYQTALLALEGFVQRLTEDEGSHQLTVLRTSRAALAARAGITSGDSVTDVSGQTVTGGSRELTRVMATSPTPLAVGLEPALELAAKLVEFADADQTHVYVLSDLREDQWRSGRTMAALLAEISRQGADIKMIDCAVKSGQNLAVTELKPLGDVWAAGVPARVSVRVRNYSDQAVTDLAVSTAVVRYGLQATQNADQPQSGTVEALPDVLFERIEPNADAVKVFQVFIDEPGTHAIQVKLPEDMVATDNQRACTLPLVAARRMLLVQGNPDDPLAYFVRSAIDPGGAIRTGWTVDVKGATFLAGASLIDLAAYDVVWLLDVPAVDSAISSALRGYVEGGGGLALWCGKGTRVENYNEYLFGDERLVPGKLRSSTPVKRSGESPLDVLLDQPHPITAPLAAVGAGMFGAVRVREALNWEQRESNQAESIQAESSKALPPTVLMRLADERPLSLVQNVGQGSVLLMLTGLDRNWTNWPADPTFVVFVLRGAAELAQGKQPPTSIPVGEKVTIDLGTEPVARNALFLPPTMVPRPLLEYAMPETAEGATVALTLNPAAALTEDQSHLSQLLVSGVAELWTTLLDGRPQVKPIALVVDGREGNLMRMERGALVQSLKPTTVEVLDATALSERTDSTGNSARVLVLLALLGMTLLGEQLVAYSASYHQRPTAAGGRS